MATTHKLLPAAEELYIKQGKTQTEINKTLGVSETTLSKWSSKYKWKSRRNAYINSGKKRVEDLKELISLSVERRLEIYQEIKEAKGDNERLADLKKEAVQLADEVSKWTKALEKIDAENRFTLSTYLEVMDDIFKHLNLHDGKLYAKTIEFQQEHLYTVATKLG